MKLNFALSLSFEGIALLRRLPEGWARIDEIALDTPDLEAGMNALRETAQGLNARGHRVALIIPNEQIRYLDLPDPGGDVKSRRSAIRSALDGATPYAVDELSYDHCLSSGRLLVAAVARETLDEAADFARQHGFVPVATMAQAPDGRFEGAVFFGKLPGISGKPPQRPTEAIRIIDPAGVADPSASPDAPVTEAQATRPEPDAKTASAGPAASEATTSRPAPPEAPRPEPRAAEADEPEGTLVGGVEQPVFAPDLAGEPSPVETRAEAMQPDPAQTVLARTPATDAAETSQTHPSEDVFPWDAPPKRSDDLNAFGEPWSTPPAPTHAGDGAAPVAGFAEDAARFVPSDETGTRGSETPAPAAKAVGRKSAQPSFASVRATRDLPQSRAAGVTADRIPGEPGAPPTRSATESPRKRLFGTHRFDGGEDRDPPTPKPIARPTAAGPIPKAPKKRPPIPDEVAEKRPPKLAKTRTPPAPAVPGPGKPAAAAVAVPGKQPAPRGGKAIEVAGKDAPAAPLEDRRKAAIGMIAAMRDNAEARRANPGNGLAVAGGADAAFAATSEEERDRMTVFGERNRDRIGGKPRFLGLLLTAVLLIFLAGVAAWASVFLDDGLARFIRGPSEDRAIATVPDPAPETVVSEPAADPAPDPDTGADTRLAALDTETDASDEPALTQPAPLRALTPEEAAATYAATGIWQRAPTSPLQPPADGVEEIYVASIDPSVQQLDAVALPDPLQMAQEPILDEPGLPPPAGLSFDFDARGLVRATPEGALSPDGLRIYAGLPPVVPPLRNPPEPEPVAEPAALPPDANIEAPATGLNRIRPQQRPDDVVEQRERVEFRGVSRAELAALRPVLRPVTAQEAAVAAEPDAPATQLAVVASLIPVTRPRNMDAIVNRAESQRPREEVRTASAAATVAPRTVSPDIPSSTTVARSATVRNAINLNRVSLIGVYGTPSNRRALVRLPNGRYLKVKVGDRVDGGRVSAIGEAELRYNKRGRNVTLQMPRG